MQLQSSKYDFSTMIFHLKKREDWKTYIRQFASEEKMTVEKIESFRELTRLDLTFSVVNLKINQTVFSFYVDLRFVYIQTLVEITELIDVSVQQSGGNFTRGIVHWNPTGALLVECLVVPTSF